MMTQLPPSACQDGDFFIFVKKITVTVKKYQLVSKNQ